MITIPRVGQSWRKLVRIKPLPAQGRRLSSSPINNRNQIITYLTDVEGDRAYLDRYVNLSTVLEFSPVQNKTAAFPYDYSIEFCNDHAVLVYGGDIWDKAGADLYCIRQLLDLRKRYSDRVHFIMGNRDLNKMRVLDELGCSEKERPKTHGGVYWLRNTGRPGDPLRQPDSGISQMNSVDRLKWMLAQTMGSPRAFELRKLELQQERGDGVTDEDVVESYRQSCHPQGEMGRYLSQAHLVLLMGQVLFLHGSLPITAKVLEDMTDTSLLWKDLRWSMPWLGADDACPKVSSITDWIGVLEDFKCRGLQSWSESIAASSKQSADDGVWATNGGYNYWPHSKTSCYGNLMQYGMGWTPDGLRNRTVVYSSWNTNGMPRRFFPNEPDKTFRDLTRAFFQAANLQLIVSGHQPNGDLPMPIRVNGNQWILCCDTSYSGDTEWISDRGDGQDRTTLAKGGGAGGRGNVAVSEVLIEQCATTGDVLDVHYHGVLSDGTPFNSTSLLEDNGAGQLASTEDLLPDGHDWWIKAKLDTGCCIASSAEEFNVWNYEIDPRKRREDTSRRVSF